MARNTPVESDVMAGPGAMAAAHRSLSDGS